jgi:RNA polymerase subunit RPABC4/transcription elongation factor Spt4
LDRKLFSGKETYRIMILIAGVSPKIKRLDDNPRRCPVCGLAPAYYKRVDHYLSLFFIPILRVKKGEAFIMCDRCEKTVHPLSENHDAGPHAPDRHCRNCGRPSQKDFKYCPFCGKTL